MLAAVKAAGLVDTLASAGPFTLFAPTNDAFDRVSLEEDKSDIFLFLNECKSRKIAKSRKMGILHRFA